MTATTTKKKLCWQCEGRVDAQAEHCPFCGVYLNGTLHMHGKSRVEEEEDDHDVPSSSQNKKNSLQPLYVPEGEKSTISPEIKAENPLKAASSARGDAIPLLFVLSGSLLFIFSLVLLLFSTDGVLQLTWDANYWFLYFLASVPLLFLGWRFLNQMNDQS